MTHATYEVDKADIQGLILRGYTHPYSCHLLFKFLEPLAICQGFFKTLYPLVQNAEHWGPRKPEQMLNIGLTYPGLVQLGTLSAADLAFFPIDFTDGPWKDASQGSLGDSGPGAPDKWWNQHFAPGDVHGVVHAYALTQADLDALVGLITAAAAANGVQELLPLAENQPRLTQSQLPNEEVHFGYRDGISEPALTRSPMAPPATPNQGDLANFLIGYGPLNGSLIQPGPTGPATGKAGTFAKNGCYNAFRVLYQDVAAFNALLAEQAQKLPPHTGPTMKDREEWLAAKMMGRWRNGSPLMLSPDAPSTATRSGEAFGYVQPPDVLPANRDPSHYRDVFSTSQCPFSAHTRVVNPRDEQLAANEDAMPPRLVRRGAPYGPPLTTTSDDGVDRGLIGLFLCGSLARQFEKIYVWINSNSFAADFNAYPTPQDALLGNRDRQATISTGFSIPGPTLQPDSTINIAPLPLLIHTRGTAYCLLPSLTSLRELAGL
jgi:deferrochelatase/peroxidase EfeB